MGKTLLSLTILVLLTACNAGNSLIVVKALPNINDTISVIDKRSEYTELKPPESHKLYSDSNFNKPLPMILKEQLAAKLNNEHEHINVQLNKFIVTSNKTDLKRAQKVKSNEMHETILNMYLGTFPAMIVSSIFEDMDVGTTKYLKQSDITCTLYVETLGTPILITHTTRVDENALDVNIGFTVKKVISDLSDEINKLIRVD